MSCHLRWSKNLLRKHNCTKSHDVHRHGICPNIANLKNNPRSKQGDRSQRTPTLFVALNSDTKRGNKQSGGSQGHEPAHVLVFGACQHVRACHLSCDNINHQERNHCKNRNGKCGHNDKIRATTQKPLHEHLSRNFFIAHLIAPVLLTKMVQTPCFRLPTTSTRHPNECTDEEIRLGSKSDPSIEP